MYRWTLHISAYSRLALLYALLLTPALALQMQSVYAIPQVQQRFVQISDSQVNATAVHNMGFSFTDFGSPVGSVTFTYCANSPISEDPCVAPSGLDVAGVVLSSQSGEVGFVLDGSTTTNRIVISRSAVAPTAPTAVSRYAFNNVVNPDSDGSYYVRVQTYSSTDGTGLALEDGGLVFAIVRQFNVTAEVPPYLLFCAAVTIASYDCSSATSFFIDLGEFSTATTRAASSEMIVATNAGYGFTVSLAGTTLTSGNNEIDPLASPAGSNPGVSQFGLNLRANSNPSIGADPAGPGTSVAASGYNSANAYKFASGDAVVSSTTTTDLKKFTVSYIANISDDQNPGIYATTISYIALANF
jgi:hypothetical protein